jgi:iron complex transport system permease protein
MISPDLIKKQKIIMLLMFMLIAITIIVGLGSGHSSLSYNRLVPTLLGQGSIKEAFILFSIRLPRIIITLLAGMALSLSGLILQGITRNDLADPGIVGINAGAGVAVTAFFLFMPVNSATFAFFIPFVAFIGALVTAGIIYLLSYDRQVGTQPLRMVIIGVGFSMALSGIMVLLISGADRLKVEFISKWLAGNIWGADWPFIWSILPWLVILIPFTLYKAPRLNLLSLSEPVTIGLGVFIVKERIKLLLAAVALAAAAVSVTGGIAFIGLMAPHMAKALLGRRNQLIIPITILLGGWLLLVADTIGRSLVAPAGIPAGIMVALMGAPYFIYLLLKQ